MIELRARLWKEGQNTEGENCGTVLLLPQQESSGAGQTLLSLALLKKALGSGTMHSFALLLKLKLFQESRKLSDLPAFKAQVFPGQQEAF